MEQRMNTLLYSELVAFYHLLDPLEDHEDEAEAFGGVLRQAVPGATSLLELGAGAGHGAHYIKHVFEQTVLTDLSDPMLERSRMLNPDCEHILGDMRSMRLDRTFDCVLVHDAIAYLLTEDDLLACMQTAFAHLRVGGAALLVPDCTQESFRECHEDHDGDDGERSLRCISWSTDPDPDDSTHITDFAFLLREAGEIRAVHDRHHYGLFAVDTWRRLAERAGFEVETVTRPLTEDEADSAYTDIMFLCRKP